MTFQKPLVQTYIESKDGDRVMIKLKGPIVEMLVAMPPDIYQFFVVYKGDVKRNYGQVLKALYGMLQIPLLFYSNEKRDLENIGFVINLYDPCVADRFIRGKQHTMLWHVDDLKSSHVDLKVNNGFHIWLKTKNGDPKLGKVKAVREKLHDYLAMNLDCTVDRAVKNNMVKYVEDMK